MKQWKSSAEAGWQWRGIILSKSLRQGSAWAYGSVVLNFFPICSGMVEAMP